MRKFLAGIGSLLTLGVLLVGIPVALIALAGNPFPSADRWASLLTTPDYAGGFLIGTLLPLIAWVAWLTFAVAFVLELPTTLRGIEAPRVGPLRLQRQGAAVLIGAVLVMFAGFGAAVGSPAGAQAVTPTAASNSTSQTIGTAPATAPEAQPAAAAQEAKPAASTEKLPTYTVRDGDSLWNIAQQHLGDGKRYTEIAQLNYGVEQADGHALTSDHWLNAGWELKLPSDANTATATQHTVQPGESLWQVAQSTLGDGDRYMELFDANQGKPQADGQSLTDPSVLRPGWVLEIPTATATPVAPAATAAPAPAATPAPAPAADSQPTQPAPASAEQTPAPAAQTPAPAAETPAPAAETPAPTPAAAPTADTSAAAAPQTQTTDVDEEDATWMDDLFSAPWRTAGGIGGVLAAGLLSLLGVRRLKQLRNRRPGQRISMPAEELTTMELELRAVENPLGMDEVDQTLRTLAVWAQDTGAELPQLYAIRLADDEIGLYLDTAADLPSPFVQLSDDKLAWTVDPAGLADLERTPSAPYPALVTLGHDESNAQILVDLEHLGALNLAGDTEGTTEALTALAIELAVSRWADDLQITLVGIAPGLPDALDTGRVRHVDDVDVLLRNLRGQAAAVERALEGLGVNSIEQARSVGPDAEGWTPEIVILGELPDEPVRAELAALVARVPRVGIAAISHGHLVGDWTLQLNTDRTAVLQPIGLQLTPQTVTPEEYRKTLALFNVTDLDSVAGPTWTGEIDQVEIDVDELPDAAPLEEPKVSATMPSPAAASVDEDDAEAWKGTLHRVLAPSNAQAAAESPAPTVSPNDTAEAVEEPETAAEGVSEAVPVDGPFAEQHPALAKLQDGPYVRLLGSVEVVNARGTEPRTAKTSYVNQATELIAFLALHTVSSAEEVSNAIWPGKSPNGDQAQQRRNGLTSRARRWLGHNDAGDPYLPPVGQDKYRVDGVTTDWQVWLELIGDDLSKTSTTDLVAALQLVQAQPFSGVKEKRYGWAERDRMEMIAAIGDAAHELAARSLKIGDFANARLAAAVGRQVDPINEVYWRDAIKAEYQAGDPQGVDRIVAQHATFLESFEDGYEPEDETAELIRRIRERQTIAG
ncbi:LysM peptidoglycan-binding domain-containing protein [Curtobacterium flaccumfaciens pv. oortii]|uniref:LysM peptidoglycan-binding domain-containing protein n=1 Tax=Curtobacterium flaccumfaciens TaxID=2035 RepID=UPI00265A0D2D|nr:LysM peptidoglycan-binding domain-containing protein [Curtobacterium flaccumfaciens]MCS5524770.1 LysM peptidoglycan-binding domain-containing protein [Curtobacterium flaccumfaciens pv. oortii]